MPAPHRYSPQVLGTQPTCTHLQPPSLAPIRKRPDLEDHLSPSTALCGVLFLCCACLLLLVENAVGTSFNVQHPGAQDFLAVAVAVFFTLLQVVYEVHYTRT